MFHDIGLIEREGRMGQLALRDGTLLGLISNKRVNILPNDCDTVSLLTSFYLVNQHFYSLLI